MVKHHLAYSYAKKEIVFSVEPKIKRVPPADLGPIILAMSLYKHEHLPYVVTCQRWEPPEPKRALRQWLNRHCKGIWCFSDDRDVAFSDDLDAVKFKMVWG